MKLFKIEALLRCSVVVAAETEAEARAEVDSWEDAWTQTGEIVEVFGLEVCDVREPKSPDLDDEAHVVVRVEVSEPSSTAGNRERSMR